MTDFWRALLLHSVHETKAARDAYIRGLRRIEGNMPQAGVPFRGLFTQAELFLLREEAHAPVAYAEIPGAQHAFEVFHSLRTRHVVQGVDRFLAFVYSRYLEQRAHEAARPNAAVS